MSRDVNITEPVFEMPEVMKLASGVRQYLRKKVRKVRDELIKEFMDHPVTQDLSMNIHGSDNLYGFIGFPKGTDPIAPILDIFNKIDVSDKPPKYKNGFFYFDVLFPTPQDIFEITPMPWAPGRSWAKGIETGISGLGYFLSWDIPDKIMGRSGGGIQLKRKNPHNPKGLRFKRQKYITDLIRRYERKI